MTKKQIIMTTSKHNPDVGHTVIIGPVAGHRTNKKINTTRCRIIQENPPSIPEQPGRDRAGRNAITRSSTPLKAIHGVFLLIMVVLPVKTVSAQLIVSDPGAAIAITGVAGNIATLAGSTLDVITEARKQVQGLSDLKDELLNTVQSVTELPATLYNTVTSFLEDTQTELLGLQQDFTEIAYDLEDVVLNAEDFFFNTDKDFAAWYQITDPEQRRQRILSDLNRIGNLQKVAEQSYKHAIETRATVDRITDNLNSNTGRILSSVKNHTSTTEHLQVQNSVLGNIQFLLGEILKGVAQTNENAALYHHQSQIAAQSAGLHNIICDPETEIKDFNGRCIPADTRSLQEIVDDAYFKGDEEDLRDAFPFWNDDDD